MQNADWLGAEADEIRTLAADAAVFGLPLILTDLVRRAHPAPGARFLDWPSDPGLASGPAFSRDPDLAASSAWLDLSEGPVVVTLPDLHGRHAVITAHDAWGGRLASLGSRVTGGIGRDVAIVGPDWRGELACGLSAVRSATRHAWITSAIWAHGAADRDATRAVARRMFLTSLCGRVAAEPETRPALLQAARPIRDQLAALRAVAFFHRLAGLLATHPPSRDDAARLEALARVGIAPGRPFDGQDLTPRLSWALEQGVMDGLDRIRAASSKTTTDWQSTAPPLGAPETAEARAVRLWNTLGAPPPEDVATWIFNQDEAGRPLDGGRRYRLRFDAHQPPPAEAFWTVDLLDASGRFTERDHGRVTVSDRLQPVWDADGGLTIPIQQRRPSRESGNWLAAPRGDFRVRLQVHWPRAAALDGRWSPPALADLGQARAGSTVFSAGTRRRSRPWPLSGDPSVPSMNGVLS